jgi:precorrin-2 dehydrogenase
MESREAEGQRSRGAEEHRSTAPLLLCSSAPLPGYYAAFLDLRGRACVVVGAGAVGLRKVEGLLASGARVTVISPGGRPEIAALERQGALRWERRGFQPGDLAGCFLAIGATGDAEVNQAMFAEAEAAGRLCNIVDVPELCNFILPALLRRGEVTVAVSTAGASPTLAQQIRDRIAALIGDEYGRMAALLRRLRPAVHARVPDEPGRKAAWRRAVASPALDLLRRGMEPEAERAALAAVGRPDAGPELRRCGDEGDRLGINS